MATSRKRQPKAARGSMTAQEMGRLGGLARTRSLSPAKRTAIARRAAQLRWAEYRRTKDAAA